jgi:hypothetical protein
MHVAEQLPYRQRHEDPSLGHRRLGNLGEVAGWNAFEDNVGEIGKARQ